MIPLRSLDADDCLLAVLFRYQLSSRKTGDGLGDDDDNDDDDPDDRDEERRLDPGVIFSKSSGLSYLN